MQTRKLMILIVEDSPLIKIRLKAMLQELDNVSGVMVAGTYEEAFDIMGHIPVNVLVLDLNLPGKSGIDVLRTIGKLKWDLTIIVLTNQSGDFYEKLCLSLGAHFFLDKTRDFDKVPVMIAGM
jgi:DNA-binding NarL/FixJ family response regulator